MCKYLSGVSGPVRVAICMCAIAMQHSHALRAKAIVCIGEPCEYMHKNVCFRVSAPSSRRILPPLGPLSRTLLQLPCLYIGPTYRDDYDVVAARRENVFGSGTCQPNVNLSGTSRNDYAHDLHLRAVVQSCIRATILPLRKVVSADTRSWKNSIDFVLGQVYLSDTDSCDLSPRNYLSVGKVTHNFRVSHISAPEFLLYFLLLVDEYSVKIQDSGIYT